MRRVPLLALAALAALAPAPALAPAAVVAEPAEPPRLAAALTACTTGPAPEDRTAAFTGSMPALAGTARMAMRFDLLERVRGDARRVRAPGLGAWERSEPGRAGFVFTKRVEQLAAPATYRARVQFRWYDADGRVQRRAQRTSPVCRQPAPSTEAAGAPIDWVR